MKTVVLAGLLGAAAVGGGVVGYSLASDQLSRAPAPWYETCGVRFERTRTMVEAGWDINTVRFHPDGKQWSFVLAAIFDVKCGTEFDLAKYYLENGGLASLKHLAELKKEAIKAGRNDLVQIIPYD